MNSEYVTTTDGVRVHLFDLRGGGQEELLMLHGVGRAGRTFSSYATNLPARFRVRAIDFRGHGQSGRADGRYRIVDYVADAVAAIDAISGPITLYGHSLGALVSSAAAAIRPERIKAVVLEDPPSPGYWHQLEATNYYPTFQAMERWASRLDKSLAEVSEGFGAETLKSFADGRVMRIRDVRDGVSVRFTAKCLMDLDPRVMRNILEGQWPEGFQLEQRFAGIQCPLLIMRGDVAKGGMLPEQDADGLLKLLKDGVRADFPAAGHLLHWQVRSEAAMQTSAFLESL